MNDDLARILLTTNIERLLRERNWSQRRLARETGDPVMSIHNVVSGRHLPTAGLLVRIADALESRLDDLFEARRPLASTDSGKPADDEKIAAPS